MSVRWKFWLITVATLLAVAATLALGRWQLSRAAQKEAWQAGMDAKAALPPLSTQSVVELARPAAELHRNVILRGSWIAQRTVFLDNRQMNGKPGLYVLTPLQLECGGKVVLVQRGWVARNFLDRSRVPVVTTASGAIEIRGRIEAAPAKLYELGGAGSGLIRQNLDMTAFSAETGLPLLTISVQQTGLASEGLLREWPQASTGVEKHYAYAFQWFALSALIAGLYFWFQIAKRFIQTQRP